MEKEKPYRTWCYREILRAFVSGPELKGTASDIHHHNQSSVRVWHWTGLPGSFPQYSRQGWRIQLRRRRIGHFPLSSNLWERGRGVEGGELWLPTPRISAIKILLEQWLAKLRLKSYRHPSQHRGRILRHLGPVYQMFCPRVQIGSTCLTKHHHLKERGFKSSRQNGMGRTQELQQSEELGQLKLQIISSFIPAKSSRRYTVGSHRASARSKEDNTTRLTMSE